MATTLAYDCTHDNLGATPAGQRAGYVTGSLGIAWTADDWDANPGAVRIDQDLTAMDANADVLDVENGAATVADCPGWAKKALAAYAANARPGQRKPAIYVNQSNMTAVANALVAGGVTSGIGLWLANYNYTEGGAAAAVAAASGPFPLIGIQYTADVNNAYDEDVFSTSWLATQSGAAGDTIAEGSSGPAVVAAQEKLNAQGETLTVDGLFGAGTLAAVKAFQAKKGLTQDGIVGPATWTALDVAPPDPPPPAAKPFAAPAGLRTGDIELALAWDAVPAVNGKSPTGYTVSVFLANGQHIGSVVVPGTSASVVLALGRVYEIQVWANGGPVAPPHATMSVST